MAKVGRPQIYNNKMLDKARKYLHADRTLGAHRIGPKRINEDDEVIPTVEGLAEKLHVARSTIYEWANDPGKKEFSDILEQILVKQSKLLVNGGLSGRFESPIVKVMLGKHGYSDKSELDVTSGGKAIGPTLAAQQLADAAIDKFLNGSGKNDTTNPQGK